MVRKENSKRLWPTVLGEDKKCIQNFDEKSLERQSLVRQRKRCEDNIKLDLRDVGCKDGCWMGQAQDRVHFRALLLAVLNLGNLLTES
jgi:hypothetical protein